LFDRAMPGNNGRNRDHLVAIGGIPHAPQKPKRDNGCGLASNRFRNHHTFIMKKSSLRTTARRAPAEL
jgi:hypothetical protein